MFPEIERELESLRQKIEDESFPSPVIRERLTLVFSHLESWKSEVDRLHHDAKELVRALVKRDRASVALGSNTIVPLVHRILQTGDARDLVALDLAVQADPSGDMVMEPQSLGASLLHIFKNDFDAAHAAALDALRYTGKFADEASPIARILQARSSELRILRDAGLDGTSPLSEEQADAESVVAGSLKEFRGAYVELARSLPDGSPEESLARLFLAEHLFFLRQFNAAIITLLPLLSEPHYRPAASYLTGKVWLFHGERAKARAAWTDAAAQGGTRYSLWSQAAVEALSLAKEPKLPHLLDQGN